ncbi:recovery protein 3 [Arabidopsis thaliana]|jgi:DNA polymerase zeta|uniref:DNA polymerase n=1 Tax=Arabidopsis thaliana TaxID=3702 RepID=A0A1P8AMM8_ARATH|nr:recovery protein 3 [Arabidopsis thaliana]NP_001320393.1 recovery protein 3 [Arabidopsis thaliana]ANM57914.1 recovery protein 3 [Arabidopsis thaliana]ANM57917.1 recovery protein 3 [Arabidopsis thaliana]|eukprot:NP_001320390.1 recovery protein 3 [Arabidopsis thaliana]
MADSQSGSNVFSLRIVSIDYYMASPIPGYNICYSSFQGSEVNEVPVIRIYGSTPAGQKTCLHIHRALPYLYIPCSEIPLEHHKGVDGSTLALSLELEKALKLKGNAASKRQHIHDCEIVRAKKFYGYHSTEEAFVKIYLYHPPDVARAASLLLAGAVLGKSLQPYESHIPFILQFLVDYNLYGMGHVHISKMKFRSPVPHHFRPRRFDLDDCPGQRIDEVAITKANSSAAASVSFPVWSLSTIPGQWMWNLSEESDTPLSQSQHRHQHHYRRQSLCELEGDATSSDILNQQFKMYNSLSQAQSDTNMVQSLVAIWEEEYERTGVHDAPIPPDPGKPSAADVLQTMSDYVGFGNMLKEMLNKVELSPPGMKPTAVSSAGPDMHAKPEITDLQALNHMVGTCSEFPASEQLSPLGEKSEEASMENDEYMKTPTDRDTPAQIQDAEALGLFKWFASSQAAEDINSDDEILRETILSPLLPLASINKVLEMASTDYVSQSQKECQDILDSQENLPDFGSSTKRALPSNPDSQNLRTSSDKQSLEIEVASDVPDSSTSNGASENSFRRYRKSDLHTSEVMEYKNRSFSKSNKPSNSVWGPLPFTLTKNLQKDFDSTNASDKLGLTKISSYPMNEMTDNYIVPVKEHQADVCNTIDRNVLAGCSLRDLMRKKRLCHGESPVSQHMKSRKVRDSRHGEKNECTLRCEAKKQGPALSAEFSEFVCGDTPNLSPIDSGNCECNISTESSELHSVDRCSAKETASQNSDEVLRNLSSTTVPFGKDPQTVESGTLVSSNIHVGIEIDSVQKSGREQESTANETDETGRLICLTLSKKPPSLDCLSAGLQDSAHSHEIHAREKQHDEYEGNSNDIPFFPLEDNKEEKKHFFQGTSLGIPLHHLNDGSNLYLLTPAFSPPSVDSVLQWISNDKGDSNIDSEKQPLRDNHNDRGASFTDLASASNVVSVSEHVEQHNNLFVNSESNAYTESEIDLKPKGTFLNLNLQASVSQELSQISGPDGKSGPTPLSQMGFRDPASMGAGQQLTILSIEVHAESRGDLRPDPRFDSVNVIALVVQNDDSFVAEVFVLLFSPDSIDQRNVDGLSGCKLSVFLEERQLFRYFIETLCKWDPDVLLGWDIQGGSIGFLAERAAQLGIRFLNNISRTPSPTTTNNSDNKRKLGNNLLPDPLVANPAQVEEVVIEDEWGRTHASGVHVGGRIVLNAWRLIRGEVKLNMYTIEAVSEAVLRQKVPSIPYKVLTEWFSSGPAGARYRCIEYVIRRANLNLEIMSQLDMINRTSELARVFGIDFFSVLSRGSQYRVESMLLRLAHTQNYLAISPGNQQVASQPAMECVPLVMEPESAFYDDPVIVLDFQSLYPSMIIAYNLCFSTCLGKLAHLKMNTLGVSSYSLDLDVLQDLNQILQTPNSVMYVPPEVRRGILPRLLEEILSTRIMVKKAMKKLTPSEAVLHRIFNARQLALKLIANVTYGYTAAGFSGRMPCAELADSIVQCGRSTLEKAISFVNANDNWNARVVYGDTDSMFVLLKGRTVKEAFVVGQEIASAITEMNPHPVTLKMEKVYHPCFLLTKKRYVGYSYESPNQREPIFDAKGIETVRRDTCEAVAKTMEQSLRLFFEQKNISKVKSYLYRQWKRILSGRVSLQDFIFAKEVRLGTYSTRDSSLLPPAAIVATKSMKADPRTEPRYAERVPYVVIHGEPGARLVDMVVDPLVLLDVDTPYRLNDLYYINKQIIPALQRVFGLVGADLNQWFLEMPRLTRSSLGQRPLNSKNSHKTRIDYFYLSKHCILCGEVVQESAQLCNRCLQNKSAAAATIVWKTSKLEREMQHLATICRHCGGGDWVVQSGVKCNSLACSVFYERRKVQKELRGLSSIATESELYPKCMAEWF